MGRVIFFYIFSVCHIFSSQEIKGYSKVNLFHFFQHLLQCTSWVIIVSEEQVKLSQYGINFCLFTSCEDCQRLLCEQKNWLTLSRMKIIKLVIQRLLKYLEPYQVQVRLLPLDLVEMLLQWLEDRWWFRIHSYYTLLIIWGDYKKEIIGQSSVSSWNFQHFLHHLTILYLIKDNNCSITSGCSNSGRIVLYLHEVYVLSLKCTVSIQNLISRSETHLPIFCHHFQLSDCIGHFSISLRDELLLEIRPILSRLHLMQNASPYLINHIK